MVDPREKSTPLPGIDPARAEVAPSLILDGRLGLFHQKHKWLAVSDLHFGYELHRRQAGGLWPMWGMQTIEERLKELVDRYQPECLILTGDVVDGAAATEEAIEWLTLVEKTCGRLILIEGNHDRGEIKRRFHFLPWIMLDGFFFHHGHRECFEQETGLDSGIIEVTGHYHPSIRFHDGAGTSLRLPALAIEEELETGKEKWVLPAFSPWAGGHRFHSEKGTVRHWACSTNRVFEVVE